ncbi:MAG: hypothetical protein Q9222_007832 [Ikaeria aurantiellina]
MLFTRIAALALSATPGIAFTDTSPFFLFSTSEYALPRSIDPAPSTLTRHLLTFSATPSIPIPLPEQITSASSIHESVLSQIPSICPSDTYIIVDQLGASTSDYQDRYAAPHLRKRILGEDGSAKTMISVSEVLGDVDTASLIRELESKCGVAVLGVDASKTIMSSANVAIQAGSFTIADDPNPRLIKLEFPPLPTANPKDRAAKLRENDDYLSSLLDLIPSSSKYTVIYKTVPSAPSSSSTTTENEEAIYEMDTSFSSQHNMAIHRDFNTHAKRDGDDIQKQNITLPNAPLFEKYQYFTPGT